MWKLYYAIYYLPYSQLILVIFLISVIWRQYGEWLLSSTPKEQNIFRIFCLVLFLLWVVVTLTITIFSRESGSVQEFEWTPFYQVFRWLKSNKNPEILRMIIMNVLLFIPGGLFLNATLPIRWKRQTRCILVLLLLTGFSIGVEVIQWNFAVGRAETDDLLCNMIGSALGITIHEHALCKP